MFWMWLAENVVGIIGIIVSAFIAYHGFFLSRRISSRQRLEHKKTISAIIEPIIRKIDQGTARKVEIVNVRKYPEKYLGDNTRDRHGYSYLGAELKALRFDGVEFFCGVSQVFQKRDGRFVVEKPKDGAKMEWNVFEVGVIPYEWVEFVDPRGDEFSYRPQFFTYFNGPGKSPY